MAHDVANEEPNCIVMFIAVSVVIGILMTANQFFAISLRSDVKQLIKRVEALEAKQ